MDGTSDSEVAPDPSPDVEPLNWRSLDPKMTKALVEAQRKAKTVDNDGHNEGQNYRYPTQAAIACRAREAMGGAGIALIQVGWSRGAPGVVHAEFVIVHEDGPVSPVFGASMPLGRQSDPTKALAGALSILRKYVLAGLLNMGWRDPTEDIDADDPKAKQRQQQPRQQGRTQQQRPAQQTRPADPVAQHNAKALQNASSWGKWLISKGLPKEQLFHYATGCDGPMPKPPPISVLDAISLAANTMQGAGVGESGLTARRHEQLISFMEHSGLAPLWKCGALTEAGASVDKQWPSGR